VAVASEQVRRGSEAIKQNQNVPISFHIRPCGGEARRIRYSRIAARSVARSAAWLIDRTGQIHNRNRLAGAINMVPKGASELPQSLSGILGLLRREDAGLDQEAIARAIVELRAADAVIVGPLSAEDFDAPGLLPHVAELANRAYRVLRPPSDLIAHSGFGQLARRFQFIQMNHEDARWLAAGAIDISTLAQCMRQLQGGQGEFAITNFSGHGVLWADNRWWEIDPIGDGHIDQARAGATFCAAWVVARRFFGLSAPKALAYARSRAAAAVNSLGKK
jgi:hypothetical protein